VVEDQLLPNLILWQVKNEIPQLASLGVLLPELRCDSGAKHLFRGSLKHLVSELCLRHFLRLNEGLLNLESFRLPFPIQAIDSDSKDLREAKDLLPSPP
jgi:hypothetical protein